MLDQQRWNRIQWRCRRGMLENDLVLTRFLAARGRQLSAEDVERLDRLLDLSDHDLWDLIIGRSEPEDHDVLPLLAQLRSA
jgi:antitoxin CptB